ncbi:MAG: tripartite tricarboxylate transporter substrate binding protein [Betaproteobacteria bacterium]|nr:tripartite tricarboxylate transporter substrate binding protein [Betaproteobacteria bacterium]
MKGVKRFVGRFAIVLAAAFACATAPAQEYPSRPIRLIVPFAPGGATDLLARELGQRLTERWNRQVVVDNRPGAGGIIGLDFGAKAAPDGYTLVMCSSSTLILGPALGTKLPYDPVKSFTLITEAADIPVVLVAHPSFPARALRELIQVAKAKPGQFAYASNGTGTTTHIAGELLKRVAGIDLIHVPYKGGGAAITDALGGQIPLLLGAVSTPLPHIKSGKLRALGVTTPRRLRELPEVPTFSEVLPNFEVRQWFGICGPAGIPRVILAKLSGELTSIVTSFASNERILRAGLEPVSSTPEKFAAYVKAELEKWTRLLREMNIQAE